MKIKRFFARLGLAAVFGAAAFTAADVAAPAPKLTPVFNDSAALPDQTAHEYRLPSLKEPTPSEAKSLWRVRVGTFEIGAGGYHTFLEFSPYDENDKARVNDKDVFQLHGIALDWRTQGWAQLDAKKLNSYTRYEDGDYVLKAFGVAQDHERGFFKKQPVDFVDVYYGSKEDVLKMYLDGMNIVQQINKDNEPYLLFKHNSNSTEHTLLKALNLPEPSLFVPYHIEALGGRLWAPGLQTNLLPKDWNRDKVRAEGGYANLTADELEARARALSGSDRMFATLHAPQFKGNKP